MSSESNGSKPTSESAPGAGNSGQNLKSQRLIELLQSKLGTQIVEAGVELSDAVVRIERELILGFFKIVKIDADLRLDYLVDITAVDWLDSKPERFELVYHLLSLSNHHRLRVKVWVPETKAVVDSLTPLWQGANYLEREVFDMYGVRFNGHPDLRRILMYDEFDGYPLRKDYPVQGKQPRIPLRNPEVRNTALDMIRPELVKISSRPRKND